MDPVSADAVITSNISTTASEPVTPAVKKLDAIIAALSASLAAKVANLTALETISDRLSSGSSLNPSYSTLITLTPPSDITYPLDVINFFLNEINGTDAEVARLIGYLSAV